MRETRSCGFVRGVPGDWYPYRDNCSTKQIAQLLRKRRGEIEAFGGADEEAFLSLS